MFKTLLTASAFGLLSVFTPLLGAETAQAYSYYGTPHYSNCGGNCYGGSNNYVVIDEYYYSRSRNRNRYHSPYYGGGYTSYRPYGCNRSHNYGCNNCYSNRYGRTYHHGW